MIPADHSSSEKKTSSSASIYDYSESFNDWKKDAVAFLYFSRLDFFASSFIMSPIKYYFSEKQQNCIHSVLVKVFEYLFHPHLSPSFKGDLAHIKVFQARGGT